MFKEPKLEDITEYANNAVTIQEPQGTDYTVGVTVGRTIPAKWWNWLFRTATKSLHQVLTDTISLAKEIQSFIGYNGLEPKTSAQVQLLKAFQNCADSSVERYLQNRDATLVDLSCVSKNFFRQELSTITFAAPIGCGWYAIYYGRATGQGPEFCYSTDLQNWTDAPSWQQDVANLNKITSDFTFCNEQRHLFYAFAVQQNGANTGRFTSMLKYRNTPVDISSEQTLDSEELTVTSSNAICQPAIAVIDVGNQQNTVFLNIAGSCYVHDASSKTIVGSTGWTRLKTKIASIAAPAVAHTLKLDETHWLIGNLKLTLTQQGLLRLYDITPVFEGFITNGHIYDFSGIKPMRLENGTIVFSAEWSTFSSASSSSTFEDLFAGKIMLPDGTLTEPPQGLKLLPAQYQGVVPGCIFAFDSEFNSYFSYDGINFELMPVNPLLYYSSSTIKAFFVCYSQGVILIKNNPSEYLSLPHRFYTTTGRLSADINDYTLQREIQMSPNEQYYNYTSFDFIGDSGIAMYRTYSTDNFFKTTKVKYVIDLASRVVCWPISMDNVSRRFITSIPKKFWFEHAGIYYFIGRTTFGYLLLTSAKPVSNYTLYT